MNTRGVKPQETQSQLCCGGGWWNSKMAVCMCTWKERASAFVHAEIAHFLWLGVTTTDGVFLLWKLMGFTRCAPSQSSERWWWCDFKEGAPIETVTCKLRLLAPWYRTECLSGKESGCYWGQGSGEKKRREGDRDLSGIDEEKNNSVEWGTGLPASWQKDISPWWQGQKPLSMSCTLQGQHRRDNTEGTGATELQRVCFSQKEIH